MRSHMERICGLDVHAPPQRWGGPGLGRSCMRNSKQSVTHSANTDSCGEVVGKYLKACIPDCEFWLSDQGKTSNSHTADI